MLLLLWLCALVAQAVPSYSEYPRYPTSSGPCVCVGGIVYTCSQMTPTAAPPFKIDDTDLKALCSIATGIGLYTTTAECESKRTEVETMVCLDAWSFDPGTKFTSCPLDWDRNPTYFRNEDPLLVRNGVVKPMVACCEYSTITGGTEVYRIKNLHVRPTGTSNTAIQITLPPLIQSFKLKSQVTGSFVTPLPVSLVYLVLLGNSFPAPKAIEDLLAGLTPKHVYLSQNGFDSIKIASARLTAIETFWIDEPVKGDFPPVSASSNLKLFGISNSYLSGDVPSLPPNIEALKLTNNFGLTSFPDSVFQTKLKYLNLQRNSFKNGLPATFGSAASLTYVNIHSNSLTGTVPSGINSLPNLVFFDLSHNLFTGNFPVLKAGKLISLSLSSNFFDGSFALDSPTQLQYLDLTLNNFNGLFPFASIQTQYLVDLWIAHNSFSGSVPANFLSSATSLQEFDISFNLFSGPLPNPPSVTYSVVDLSYNAFTGDLVYYFGTTRSVAGNRLTIINDTLFESQIPFYRKQTFVPPTLTLAPQDTNLIADDPYYSPQDEDECALGIALCAAFSTCSDGWTPRMSYTCSCQTGYAPVLSDDLPNRRCSPQCGDGQRVSSEVCDYSAPHPGFDYGCTLDCKAEAGYSCNPTTGMCSNICGDGLTVAPESCDLGTGRNGATNSGCDSSCQIVSGFQCVFTGTSLINCSDINECQTGAWASLCSSQDQCQNTPGSFTCCSAGFRVGETSCVDINECTNSDWQVKPSQNTGAPCASRSACVNTNGAFQCCGSGFSNADVTGTYADATAACQDINECTNGAGFDSLVQKSLSGVPCTLTEQCVNTVGNFSCCDAGFRNEDPVAGSTCIDINECVTGEFASRIGLNATQCSTRSACVNTDGSFWCCPAGYENTDLVDGTSCADINECLNTDWQTKISLRGRSCESKSQCQNTDGNFTCCDSGYYNPDLVNGADCIDINECLIPTSCYASDVCRNLEGSFDCCPEGFTADSDTNQTCVTCFSEWTQWVNPEPYNPFPSLDAYNSSLLYFSSCVGSCDSARRTIFRYARNSPCASRYAELLATFENCDYACTSDLVTDAENSIAILVREFSKGNFLQKLVQSIFEVNLTLTSQNSRKRANFGFSYTPCEAVEPDVMVDFINNLALDILPNSTELLYLLGDNCTIGVQSSDPPNLLGLAIGLPLGLLCLLLILLALASLIWQKNRHKLDWSGIPESISWSFRQYEHQPAQWDYRGTKDCGFFYKEYDSTSKDYHRVKSLFDGFLRGQEIDIVSITAVYNKTLISNWLGAHRIMQQRFLASPHLFLKKDWQSDQSDPLREWVYDQYNLRVKELGASGLTILPTIHGTSGGVANKIVETGFAALSSIDDGYYGKGIYFTTHAPYSITYIKQSPDPTMIISYVLPGNTYPVIEHPKAKDSLLGLALKSGYNSHFVATTFDGVPLTAVPTAPGTPIFDEVVIGQESQIVPAFIVAVEKKGLTETFQRYQKRTTLHPLDRDDKDDRKRRDSKKKGEKKRSKPEKESKVTLI